ncbi:MAG: sigma-54-dependent Fis family transcriptional regulator [Firmicutes bacterium]|nr:sigma-54-dependent Fis family transcriptional regulator [Bacillota bacterium]
MARILIVEDNIKIQKLLLRSLEQYQLDTAVSGSEAVSKVSSEQFQAVLLDVVLPDSNDLEILRKIKELQPDCQVIVMTGHGSIPLAVDAIKSGAYDFIEKPFSPPEIKCLLTKAIGESPKSAGRLPENVVSIADRIGFVGYQSKEIQELLLTAYKIANKDLNVLICGETGTGKEFLARFIHTASMRSNERFFPVNCGALTESLVESELFGHEKGAFTGADRLRRGCFELADKGTIFLDEVGEASLSLQAKFLRVLETGEFQRVGGEHFVTVDVRVLAATNVDLVKAVKKKIFREDLYYRLGAVLLHMPPLRNRRDDILSLAYYFIRRSSVQGTAPVLSPEAIQVLLNYSWPGNVRELSNVVQQAVAFTEGGVILPAHLPVYLRQNKSMELINRLNTGRESILPPPSIDECEKAAITAALEYCKGSVPEAAAILGIGQATLYRKINKLNLMTLKRGAN